MDWTVRGLSRKLVAAMLVATNLVPLLGVVFLDWAATDVILLYWAETGIIGAFTIVRMVLVAKVYSLIVIPFFLFHFGAFMWAHLFFLVAAFVGSPEDMAVELSSTAGRVWFAFILLIASHAVSFVVYVIVKKEPPPNSIWDLTVRPYLRVFLMHITVVLVMWAVERSGEATVAVAFMVGAKIAADLLSHLAEHANKPRAAPSGNAEATTPPIT